MIIRRDARRGRGRPLGRKGGQLASAKDGEDCGKIG
jgi:hypothetical protein